MGIDLDFFIKVDDPLFIPTPSQLVAMVHLLDKHGLAANHYPSDAENARILADLRENGIIHDVTAPCRELKSLECQLAASKHLRARGWEPHEVDLWTGVQSYDITDFPTPPARNRYSEYDRKESNTHMIRLISKPGLIDSIQGAFERFIGFDFPAGVDYPYFYYLCRHGTMFIHEVEFIKDHYVPDWDPHCFGNTRFIIFREWAGRRGNDDVDPDLSRFVDFFTMQFRGFLDEASVLCGHPVVPDVHWA